jgi:peptide/nickel transport system permease protein
MRRGALGVRTAANFCGRTSLPNLMSPILVQVTFIFAYAILAEAGLSFLGVGVPPEIPTWGTMIAGGLEYSDQARSGPSFVPWPCAIILTAVSLQTAGRRCARSCSTQN